MKRFLALPVFVLLAVACSSHRTVVIDPFAAGHRLSDYRVLEIPDLTTAITGELDQEILREIPNGAMKKVKELALYDEVVRRTERTENVLVMEGVVVSYERGTRWKRAVPTGAGKAYCTIQVTFRDKARGDSVAKMNFEGEISSGLLGGSATDSAKSVVAAIGEYFRQNF